LTFEQQPGSFQRGIWTGIVMASDTTSRDSNGTNPDDPAELDAVAGRLEAALDRIVRHLDNPRRGGRNHAGTATGRNHRPAGSADRAAAGRTG
jgi:hypothetical protein